MNLRGEPVRVGQLCGSHEYAVDAELVAFYAMALDDEHPLHSEFAPPLVFHSECYRFVGDWYLRNLVGNLHGQQDWELFAPIPVGSRVRTRSTVVDRFAKRGRDYVVNETDVCSADDGKLLVRGRTYQSFLQEGPAPDGFVVDREGAARKPKRPSFPTAEGPDLEPASMVVDARRCWMFSGPGRNYHTDPEEAKKLGFPTVVVQGMLSTCLVSRVMERHFGTGWLSGGRMSVKLTNVIWMDEEIQCRARVRDETPEGGQTRVHCEVWVEKQGGELALLGTASGLRSE